MKAIFCNLRKNIAFEFKEKVLDLTAENKIDLIKILKSIEEYTSNGYFIAGFISYEAGYYLLDKKIIHKNRDFPLLHFSVFKKMVEIPYAPNLRNGIVYDLKYSENETEYKKKLGKIKEHLKNGDTYQTNYTIKANFKSSINPENLFYELCENQDSEYSAFLDFENYSILSLSPELFLSKNGNTLTSKPMKGTLKVQIENSINSMKNDEKIISENSIIVDLIRNDMSIIAEKGTVIVKNPFEIQEFKTINQMITTVECKIKNKSFFEVLKALFPCGSITGAPKIRTMEIISQNETTSRGVYCGSIGYILPNNDFLFNVAIRTPVFNKKTQEYSMGIGSGITHESESKDEFNECKLKSQFVRCLNNFEIFETMKSVNGKIKNFELHIERLKKSCNFFGFNFKNPVFPIIPISEKKVKISILQNGEYKITIDNIEKILSSKIKVSKLIVDSKNILLQHKTTLRDLYEKEYKKYSNDGFFDVIFQNEFGHITEGSRCNIFIKKDGKYFTPPLNSGILPGVTRDLFIKKNQAIERNITLKDLKNADEIYLSNSIRGIIKVIL